MTINKLSILSNASQADIRLEPYPHLVIKNALDEDVFHRLAAEFPEPETVLNGRSQKDTWFDYPACHAIKNPSVTPLWKEFMEYHVSNGFFQEVVALFGDKIKEAYPDIEQHIGKELINFDSSMRYPERGDNSQNHQCDVSLECQFYINYSIKPRIVRGPHVDRPTELYAALLYFRDENDTSTGSDLQVCSAKDSSVLYPKQRAIKVDSLPMEISPEKVDVHSTAKYEANTLVFFLNSARSIHAVTPRSATRVPRRHINFTADLFNLPSEGLFEVKYGLKSAAKKWLEDKPVVWRMASLIKE